MVLHENPCSTPKDRECCVESSRQSNEPEWHSYSQAAVKQQKRLASLNERLARFLRFVFDVEVKRHKSQVSWRWKRSSRKTEGEQHSRRKKFPHDESGYQSGRARTTDSSYQYSSETEELGETIEEGSQGSRNTSSELKIRVDTLRRAVNSLKEENEELLRKNTELVLLKAESDCEVQLLKDENGRLEEEVRRMGRIDEVGSRTTDHDSSQDVISSLQQENRRLKARLDGHKQILRKGLDDFISRSSEALLNGTSMQKSYEKVLAYDSDDEMGITTMRPDLCASSSSGQKDLAWRRKMAQLEGDLKSATEEIEREKFRSQRRIKVIREISDQLREDLTRKNNSLQRTNEELETALEVLRSLVDTGGGTTKEIDAYRCLLERAESRLDGVGDDSSADSSSASEAPHRSWKDSDDSDQMESLHTRCDAARMDSRCLEIEKHDVRRGKFVVLGNKSDKALDISRWYLVQQCGKNKVTHRFPSPFILKAKTKTIVWSADVKAGHRSPVNYVMAKTVFPWCQSGEVDLVTKVYDRQGYQISKLETRIHIRPPVGSTVREVLRNSDSLVHDFGSEACSIS